jgi:TRAP-type mannitol/chloroaromatic compound transport system permease small subunit
MLNRVVNGLELVSEKTGVYTAWLTALLVLVVCYDVFTRYLLQYSSVGMQELEWHLFAVIFLFGAAYTLKHDRHVRVDVIYTRFTPHAKAWVNLIGSLLFLLPFAILVIVTSHKFVINSFLMQETSPDPGGLPARFILKACIPLSFLLVFLQGLALTGKSLLVIMRKEPATERED